MIESNSPRAGKRGFSRPRGYWTHMNNIVAELLQFVEDHGLMGRMPTIRELKAHGRGDLAGAVRRKGGWELVASEANLTPTSIAQPRSIFLTYTIDLKRGTMKPHKYWLDFENLRAELEGFMDTEQDIDQYSSSRTTRSSASESSEPKPQRRLPTTAELEAAKRYDLMRAIQKHGGMEAVARRMDLRCRYHAKGYWDDLDNVRRELQLIASELDLGSAMPAAKLISAIGPPGLNSAIRAHGGRHAVATALQLETTRRPRGYWSANVAAEVSAFVDEHRELLQLCTTCSELSASEDEREEECGPREGEKATRCRMPTKQELVDAGRGDLAQAITRWSSMGRVAKKLGLEYSPEPWSSHRRGNATG